MKQMRIVVNFRKLKGVDLQARAGSVRDNLYTSTFFTDPPVSQTEYMNAYNQFSDGLVAVAYNGAKTDFANRDAAREVLIGCLRRLVPYVEVKSQGDPVILVSSGFEVSTPTSTPAPTFLSPPKIRKLFHGPRSGEICLYIKADPDASSYKLRYAILTDGLPGDWTEQALTKVKQAITISGLTPGKVYAFQVQSLGDMGYSDWSQSVTLMAI